MARLGCLLWATLLAHGSSAVLKPAAPTGPSYETSVWNLTPTHGSELDTDFLRLRRELGTRLLLVGSAPDLYRDPPTTEGVRLDRYLSDGNELKVWQLPPSGKSLWSDRGFPVVIYVHDGTTLTEDELAHAETFRAAGFWVVVPTFRGENGNLGTHELLFGELDDLVAATYFARALPEIDASRMAIFGHGTGGMLSALASLVPQLPAQRSISSAGLRPENAFEVLRGPFADSAQERRLRLFGPNVNHMQSPHLACVAEQDPAVYSEAARVLAVANEAQLPLEVLRVPGSRSASRDECETRTARYLSQTMITKRP
jgi:acetyl esterase/lipase